MTDIDAPPGLNASPIVDNPPDVDNSPDVDTPDSVPATPTLLERLPNEIWLKIFRIVAQVPKYALVKRQDITTQAYMRSEYFAYYQRVRFGSILLSCRAFNNMLTVAFYTVNAFGFGYNAMAYHKETPALFPPLRVRSHLRRIHLILILNDFYRPAPNAKPLPIASVNDLFQWSHNARLLRDLTNVAGFSNLESLRINITTAYIFDPFVALSILQQANITLTARRVRMRTVVFHCLHRLTTVQHLFNVVQTVDDGSPYMGKGVDARKLTHSSFVVVPADKGPPRFKVHPRHQREADEC
jgi:hypothetical protein